VIDTGVGVRNDEGSSIFQPFQRGQAGGMSGGSGVGLAVVDRLVHDLGLTLEVTSEPGRGSRFALVAPAAVLRVG
jgi:signal transduction histidine kinase